MAHSGQNKCKLRINLHLQKLTFASIVVYYKFDPSMMIFFVVGSLFSLPIDQNMDVLLADFKLVFVYPSPIFRKYSEIFRGILLFRAKRG